MAGLSATMFKNFKAEAAVTKRRIVKFGAADNTVLLAAAALDALLGVSHEIDSAIGEPVDVALKGLVEVEYGGVVTRGDPLTSDATGRAVAAAPAAGVNARIVGFAMASGVLGDIGVVDLEKGRIQG